MDTAINRQQEQLQKALEKQKKAKEKQKTAQQRKAVADAEYELACEKVVLLAMELARAEISDTGENATTNNAGETLGGFAVGDVVVRRRRTPRELIEGKTAKGIVQKLDREKNRVVSLFDDRMGPGRYNPNNLKKLKATPKYDSH